MPKVPDDYATRLRKMREAYGLTMGEVAAFAGVSVLVVERWEAGKEKPTFTKWLQLGMNEEVQA